MYIARLHRGGLAEAMETATEFETELEMKQWFVEQHEDAFDVVNTLEEKCRELFVKESRKCAKKNYIKPWLDDYAQLVGRKNPDEIKEDPEAVAIITAKNKAAAEYVKNAKPLGFVDASLQRAVYLFKYSKMKNKNK